MHLRNPKRLSLLGFVAGAAVLALAGTAFACTELRGKVTITGPGNGSATYRGDGTDATNTASSGYCETPSRVGFTSAAAAMTFTLAVERQSCAPNDLEHGAYEVRWIKATDAIDHTNYDCNRTDPEPLNPWVPIGVMNVANTASGTAGSGTFALAETMRGPGNICVVPVVPNNTAVAMIFMKWTVV